LQDIDKNIPLCILWYMYTLINIKTEKELKASAQAAAKKIGVPLSTVINSFLKQFVRDEEVTFSGKNYVMTPYLEALIEESFSEDKRGENKYYSDAGSLLNSLKS